MRDELRRRLPFPTVDGGSLALADAPDVLAIAAWDGPWLPPEAGELEPPVVLVPHGADELRQILEALHGEIVDASDRIAKLQAQRRIRRGQLPLPQVRGAAAEVKRPLADLGELARPLGPGEIALVDGMQSSLLLHVHGELRRVADLPGVIPPVQIAIEAPDLVAELDREHPLSPQLRALGLDDRRLLPGAQELATLLVDRVLATLPHDALPGWLRRTLRRAVLSRALVAQLAAVPIFDTVNRGRVTWQAIAEQIEQLGDVWAVARQPANPSPLDARRMVLLLDIGDLDLARQHDLAIADATRELELDAIARANKNRRPARSLAIDPADDVLAVVPLAGDGVTAARGAVAVLAPRIAHRRAIRAHRALHPFDPVTDVCRWPTLAIVDDARLVPDRTWSRARHDQTWSQVVDEIRVASEHALRSLFAAPADALAVETISHVARAGSSARSPDAEPVLEGMHVRGMLWLAGPPGLGAIEVRDVAGTRTFAPGRSVALGGSLLVHTDEPDATGVDGVLDQVCAAAHGAMVRELIAWPPLHSTADVITAHVAHALALERILPVDARAISFGCFRPHPLGAAELRALLRGSATIRLVDPAEESDEPALVDDGSELARVLLRWLGARADRLRREPARPPPLPVPRRPPTAPPARPPAYSSPRPAHELDILVASLSRRLVEIGVPVVRYAILEGRSDPIVSCDDGLALAADNEHLRRIAAACLARTAWADAAVDALAAHIVSLLNIAFTAVTDATEAHALGALLARA